MWVCLCVCVFVSLCVCVCKKLTAAWPPLTVATCCNWDTGVDEAATNSSKPVVPTSQAKLKA